MANNNNNNNSLARVNGSLHKIHDLPIYTVHIQYIFLLNVNFWNYGPNISQTVTAYFSTIFILDEQNLCIAQIVSLYSAGFIVWK